MAKVGLEYFPFDVYSDNKIKLIEAEFGLTGFAVIVKLWQKIYAERGYYCEFDEEVALLFANEIKVGVGAVSEIVKAAIKRGIFQKELYDKYKVLTSHGIQSRYTEATVRRVRVELEEKYLLLGAHEIKGNVDIIGKNVCRNQENVYITQQSKVEESKVKKSKVKESKGEIALPPYNIHGYYKNVMLTDIELESLKEEFPQDYKDRIEKLSEYMASSGKEYKSHFATIKKWAKEDKEKTINNPSRPVKKKLCNYTDTSNTDYRALEEELLDGFLDS